MCDYLGNIIAWKRFWEIKFADTSVIYQKCIEKEIIKMNEIYGQELEKCNFEKNLK